MTQLIKANLINLTRLVKNDFKQNSPIGMNHLSTLVYQENNNIDLRKVRVLKQLVYYKNH